MLKDTLNQRQYPNEKVDLGAIRMYLQKADLP